MSKMRKPRQFPEEPLGFAVNGLAGVLDDVKDCEFV